MSLKGEFPFSGHLDKAGRLMCVLVLKKSSNSTQFVSNSNLFSLRCRFLEGDYEMYQDL